MGGGPLCSVFRLFDRVLGVPTGEEGLTLVVGGRTGLGNGCCGGNVVNAGCIGRGAERTRHSLGAADYANE